MVSWGRAFVLAIKAFLLALVWSIIGGLIILLGAGLTLLGALSNPEAISDPTTFLLANAVWFFIGSFIASLGSLASIIKVSVDEAVKEVEKYKII